jgi:hypothetical protein
MYGGGKNNGDFRLTVKASLIFGTENHFLDLNSSFLHALLWNLPSPGIGVCW